MATGLRPEDEHGLERRGGSVSMCRSPVAGSTPATGEVRMLMGPSSGSVLSMRPEGMLGICLWKALRAAVRG